MTDEQYYQMRNEEGDVRALAAEPALLPLLRRGSRWLRRRLGQRQASPIAPPALDDTASASESDDARAA